MSYILDALKKSDRERPRDAPALPLHEVPAFRLRPGRSRRSLLAAGVAVLLLVAGVAGAWVARQTREAKTAAIQATVQTLPITIQATATDPAARTDAQAPIVPSASPNPESTQEQSAPPPASVTREGLLELWQLTEAEQKYLQGLDVSFHVHSNDPSKRAVIINGLRAGEGQSLGEDLRLTEIVPDGIVLEFQGQFVHLANPQPY